MKKQRKQEQKKKRRKGGVVGGAGLLIAAAVLFLGPLGFGDGLGFGEGFGEGEGVFNETHKENETPDITDAPDATDIPEVTPEPSKEPTPEPTPTPMVAQLTEVQVEISKSTLLYNNVIMESAAKLAEKIKTTYADNPEQVLVKINTKEAVYDAVEELKLALEGQGLKYEIAE